MEKAREEMREELRREALQRQQHSGGTVEACSTTSERVLDVVWSSQKKHRLSLSQLLKVKACHRKKDFARFQHHRRRRRRHRRRLKRHDVFVDTEYHDRTFL